MVEDGAKQLKSCRSFAAYSDFARWRRSRVMRGVPLVFLLLFMVGITGAGLQARGPVSVADIAEELQESVVLISSSQAIKGAGGVPLPSVPKGSPFEEFFEDFFYKQDPKDLLREATSTGSGFVIDPSGIIVTNNHVIEDAEEIIVAFNDGTRLTVVKVLGRDPETDLALLKVEPKKPLKAVKFADSEKLRVGDWVMALGNPFGLGLSVSVGVVSAKNRVLKAGSYDNYIQTDAAINRGNSGGPLFNMDGEVVGVNTAIISPSGVSVGIGFAISSSTASPVIEQLKTFGETRRGWLGVQILSVNDEIAKSLGMVTRIGAYVSSVDKGSPAEDGGLKVGDIVVKFDGHEIADVKELPRIVASTQIDEIVDVEVLRNGKQMTLRVKIGRLPEGDGKGNKKTGKAEDVENGTLLGLVISTMTDTLRTRYKIGKDVKGVVITEVAADSVMEQKGIKPGDVIVEASHKEVKAPEDVAKRVEAVAKSGRKSILLLISDRKGDLLQLVAVPLGG